MRVPLSWLKDYVTIDRSVHELAHRLTLAGVEVESAESTGGDWKHVYVGEIVKLERHPNADRLQLATVNYGQDTATVVTGAPNISVGDRVPFALVGAELIDMHQTPPRKTTLKPSKIRGVESAGMVCSSAELGLGDDHAGILILDKSTRAGLPLAEALGDTVLTLKLTPNRSDCLSMLGVAQEVAALLDQRLVQPVVEVNARGRPAAEQISVEIADPDLCYRYTAAIVDGVQVAPSPAWMQERLTASGVRPINNVVDVTNYVMLEYGQPLHAFDFARIRGQKIVVRRALPGERIRTLDGVDRTLEPDRLVIADAERAVAVAGVMGGEDSEVSTSTTTVLLESATFEPKSVRRTARALRLPSEASRRFEKGLPSELAIVALARAAQLLREVAGGEIAPGWVDTYPVPTSPRAVELPMNEFERLLGVRYTVDEVTSVLGRLGFDATVAGETLRTLVPYRRVDVAIPADVVEEVARVRGYDNLPTRSMAGPLPGPEPADAPYALEEKLRNVLVGCGLDEIITYSMISEGRLERIPSGGDEPLARELDDRLNPAIEPLKLVNPLSSEMDSMRTTAFAHVLEAVRDNLRWTDRDVWLFEIGRIYLPKPGQLPEERRVLTIASGAFASGGGWGSRVEVDFYHLKGVVETMLDRMGVVGASFVPVSHPLFSGGQAAAVVRVGGRNEGRTLLGVFGEVSLRVRRAFDLDQRCFLGGFDLDRVFALRGDAQSFRPLARYPGVFQDLAVVLAESVSAEDVRRAILRAGRPLAVGADLFDIFRGERLGPGRRSLAYRITYQAPDRTLTDAEVAEAHGRIEAAVRKQYDAEIRGR